MEIIPSKLQPEHSGDLVHNGRRSQERVAPLQRLSPNLRRRSLRMSEGGDVDVGVQDNSKTSGSYGAHE